MLSVKKKRIVCETVGFTIIVYHIDYVTLHFDNEFLSLLYRFEQRCHGNQLLVGWPKNPPIRSIQQANLLTSFDVPYSATVNCHVYPKMLGFLVSLLYM